jgi:hypothetical protein
MMETGCRTGLTRPGQSRLSCTEIAESTSSDMDALMGMGLQVN